MCFFISEKVMQLVISNQKGKPLETRFIQIIVPILNKLCSSSFFCE